MVKVTAERLPHAQVVLNIEVEPEAVEKATERAYRSLANRVNVPGFRRGKAPRFMVERMIGGPEALRQEGIDRLIPEVYREAVEQAGVDPIDQPEVDVVSVEPLVVKATVSVQPEIELGDYKSVRVPKVPVDVPYERINQTIEWMREQQTRWEPVERPARGGDRIVADVTGSIGAAPTLYDASGQPLLQTEGREQLIDQKNAEFEVNPESDEPVPGFHKELVGLAPKSEKRFLLSLPESWPNEPQRGQSILFHVVVHEVKEAKVPALDDEFAKSVGEYETLDALREDVRERLRQQLEHEAEHVYRDAVIQEVVSRSTIELPPALIRRETERLVRNFERNLARQRLSLDQYLKLTNKSEDELREELRPNAETNLNSYLVMREVANAEKVEVADEEIDQEIERIVASIQDPAEAERARELLGRDREDLRASLWERKVVALLTSIAQQPAETGEGETEASAADDSTSGAAPAGAAQGEQPAGAAEPAGDSAAAGGATTAQDEADATAEGSAGAAKPRRARKGAQPTDAGTQE